MTSGAPSTKAVRTATALLMCGLAAVAVVLAVATIPPFADAPEILGYLTYWVTFALIPAVLGLAVLRDWRVGWLGAGVLGLLLAFLGTTNLTIGMAPLLTSVVELAAGLGLLVAVLIRAKPPAGGTPVHRRSG